MINKIDIEGIDLKELRSISEDYYRNGDFYCSEAVVKAIKDEFKLPVDDHVIAAASGFPIGIGGAGCTCGAVSGGVMALGLVFGRSVGKDEKVDKAMALSKELHDTFKDRHKFLCCRALTKNMELGSSIHMEQCISFTGEVAEEVGKIIIREKIEK